MLIEGRHIFDFEKNFSGRNKLGKSWYNIEELIQTDNPQPIRQNMNMIQINTDLEFHFVSSFISDHKILV